MTVGTLPPPDTNDGPTGAGTGTVVLATVTTAGAQDDEVVVVVVIRRLPPERVVTTWLATTCWPLMTRLA